MQTRHLVEYFKTLFQSPQKRPFVWALIVCFSLARASLLITPIAFGWVQNDLMHIGFWGLATFALARLSQPFFSFFQMQLAFWLMSQASFELFMKTFEKLMTLSPFDINQKPSAVWNTQIEQALVALRFTISVAFTRLVPVFFEFFIVCFYLLLFVDVIAFVIFSSIFIIYIGFLYKSQQLQAKYFHDRALNQQRNRHQLTIKTLQSFDFLKIYQLSQGVQPRVMHHAFDEYYHMRSRYQVVSAQEMIEFLIVGLVHVALFTTLILLAQQHLITSALVLLLLFLFQQIVAPVSQLSWIFRELPTEINTLESFLATQYLTHQNAKITYQSQEPLLFIKHLDIAFDAKPTDVDIQHPAVHLNLRIENQSFFKGQRVCVYGPIGSGKSLFFKALCQQVPNQGHLYLQPHTRIAMVLQEPSSFANSLDDFFSMAFLEPHEPLTLPVIEHSMASFFKPKPFTYPYPTQKLTSEQCTHVWRILQDLDPVSFLFFKSMWHIPLTQQRLPFSGGQKALLMIAFAICKKPSILLLDECSAALDSQTEQRVYATLNRYLPDCCLLFITHRLSNLPKIDYYMGFEHMALIHSGTLPDALFATLSQQPQDTTESDEIPVCALKKDYSKI